MYNHYLYSRSQIRYSVFLFSLTTFQLNNLWEQIHVIKTWLQLLIKKHASRELFKNSIYKENCRTFTNWESKRNAISKSFYWESLRSRRVILNLWYQHHCNVVVEITDAKCGLLSKLLFQRTQQHGGCTKPLGKDACVKIPFPVIT